MAIRHQPSSRKSIKGGGGVESEGWKKGSAIVMEMEYDRVPAKWSHLPGFGRLPRLLGAQLKGEMQS